MAKRRPKGRTWRRRRRRKCDEAVRDTKPDTSEPVVQFLRWFRQRGFRNTCKLRVYHFAGLGRGVRTSRRAIQTGDCLFHLPQSCLLIPHRIRRLHATFSAFLKDDHCLIAFLMHQRWLADQNIAAEWSPYVSILPRNYDHLLFLQPNIESELAKNPTIPRSFVQLVAKFVKSMKTCEKEIQTTIQTHHLSIEWNVSLFHWAFAVVTTRAVNPNPKMSWKGLSDYSILVPLFDLINHSTGTALDVQSCTLPNESFTVQILSCYKRYSQLFLDYDECMSNREFLLNYNFHNVIRLDNRPSSVISVRFCPSSHDRIHFSYKNIKAILQHSCQTDSVSGNKTVPRVYLDRILHRLKYFDSELYVSQKLEFELSWPSAMFKHGPMAIRLTDTQRGLTELTYERPDTGQLETLPDIDLDGVCSRELEYLCLLIAKSNLFDHCLDFAVLTTAWERRLHWTVKCLLVRGLLRNEFGLTCSQPTPLTIVHLYDCLHRIDCSVTEPLTTVLRNELGLLFYVHYRLENNNS